MTRAVLAKRGDEAPVRTDEFRRLAGVAGYEVVAERTQVRPADAAYDLGAGAVEAVADLVAERDAGAVLVDNDLTPAQAHNWQERLPPGTAVRDRRRVVLDVFREGAGTREARLQVRLAELRYELPRVRAALRRDEATEVAAHDEEGKPVEDRKRRIAELERQLREFDPPDRHDRRREAGFDLVALAGYTNAGKTTLLRRLADDLSLAEGGHDDLAASAAVDDHPFETLGTTTRRATIEGRRALVTDTVGFVRDLPHELVAAFRATLAAARRADVVLLVVDASDPPDRLRGKVATARAELDGAEGPVVPVLTKADLVDGDLSARRAAVAGLGDPVVVSATEGRGLDALRARVRAELPAARADLRVPNCDRAMSFVSWAYDALAVEDVTYAGDGVRVTATGRPDLVERARAEAAQIRGDDRD